MSVFSELDAWITSHVTALEAAAKKLLAHEDPAVKAIGEDLKTQAEQLRTDAESAVKPVLAEAKADLKQDAHAAAQIVEDAAGTAAPTTSAATV